MKGRHFSSDAEVIAAAKTWLDGQPSEFFSEWFVKVKILVAVACFLPGRAEDLSAPRYIGTCHIQSSPVHFFLTNLIITLVKNVVVWLIFLPYRSAFVEVCEGGGRVKLLADVFVWGVVNKYSTQIITMNERKHFADCILICFKLS